VEHQQLLRQDGVAGEVGEPGGHRVHLVDPHRADLLQRPLVRPQPPLRVQRQPDVRLAQQLLVAAGLGQEVGAAGLQVEQHVHPGRARGVHPRPEELRLGLGAEVAVGAGPLSAIVLMISNAGTTVSSDTAWYSAASACARATDAATSCSPSTPSAGTPGCP
jgi:hypothetical protein